MTLTEYVVGLSAYANVVGDNITMEMIRIAKNLFMVFVFVFHKIRPKESDITKNRVQILFRNEILNKT